MRGAKRAMSPTALKRMPLSCSFATSCSSACANRSIRIVTSSGGRRQFSLENANSVRYSMPRSIAPRTAPRTASTPLRWPATRGRWRARAQRPLPSMMIATWRGVSRALGTSRVELGNADRTEFLGGTGKARGSGVRSDRHQVRFLRVQDLVDLGDVAVGELLNIGLCMPLVVLRALLVLQHLLQMFVGVAADVADRDLRRFGLLVHDLRELLAALFGERRHRDADHVAGRRRIESEVRIADGLLDHRDHLLLERLHSHRPRVGQRDIRHLIDRHHRAVIVDVEVVEQAGVRAPRAHLRKIGFQRFNRLLHLLLGGSLDVADHRSFSFLVGRTRDQQCTSVPSSSPSTTRFNAPGTKIENTFTSMFWSRQSASAVASITFKFLTIASSNVSVE